MGLFTPKHHVTMYLKMWFWSNFVTISKCLTWICNGKHQHWCSTCLFDVAKRRKFLGPRTRTQDGIRSNGHIGWSKRHDTKDFAHKKCSLLCKKQYLFIFLCDFEWFVFQHTTVWGMQHIVLHHASQNAPVFLIARRNHLMVWTSCNEAESQARMPFTAGWKNADWLCLNKIREVSAMAKKNHIWVAPSLYTTSILCRGHFWGPNHVTWCEY